MFSSPSACHEVYPRPRGGTRPSGRIGRRPRGLSPPTRGNRRRANGVRAGGGSIPAHAGEPLRQPPLPPFNPVYPRPRGGTPIVGMRPRMVVGLSPPTRGNLEIMDAPPSLRGSIPAHAGEPVVRHVCLLSRGVYPRPRGGTNPMNFIPSWRWGLSPPTRGNRSNLRPGLAHIRSIPAHAGEP